MLPEPYYQDNHCTIYHGDCREILPHVSADVLVTDPPYGLGFDYLSYDDTRDSLVCLIAELESAGAFSGRAFVMCGPTQIGLYPEPSWVSAVTWNTTGSFGSFGYNQWMPVLCYGRDLSGFGNINGVIKSDTLSISGGASVGFQRGCDEKKHTCPKPIGIMRWIVQRFTGTGETILDPFTGSGTTLRAAKDLGRKAIGIEIEEKYCEIAARRLAQEVLF